MPPADDRSRCFTCLRCENRVERGGAEIGAKVKCPTCGLELIVPRQSQVDAGAGQGRGEDDEYALGTEPPSSPAAVPYLPQRDFRDPRILAEREEQIDQRGQSVWQTVHRAPPLGLFFRGTFSFPFHSSAQVQSLTLAGGAMVVCWLLKLAIWCGGGSLGGITEIGPSVAGLLMSATGLALLAMWAVVASVYGLAVLRETSYGCGFVEKWPIGYSLDGMGESLYVFSGIALSVLPGLVAAPLWDWLDWPRLLMISVVAVLLFPVLLLSMLEANSPMKPVSLPVWQSVATAWRAWGLFYLIALPTAAVLCVLVGAALARGGIGGAVPAGILLSAAWMIYFRLLGRLAWFCSGRAAACQRRQGMS